MQWLRQEKGCQRARFTCRQTKKHDATATVSQTSALHPSNQASLYSSGKSNIRPDSTSTGIEGPFELSFKERLERQPTDCLSWSLVVLQFGEKNACG